MGPQTCRGLGAKVSLLIHNNMATINNAELTKELIDGAKIQLSSDNVPGRLADAVVPTMEVNPKLFRETNFIEASSRNSAGAVTIVTTDANKVTFMTEAWIGITKDVANDTTTSIISLKIYQNGQLKEIMGIPSLTLTAQDSHMVLSFKNPVKLDKNTTVRVGSILTGAGSALLCGGISGYIEEP